MLVRSQSLSSVKSHLAQAIKDSGDGNGPLIITQKGVTVAVLQDAEFYKRTQDALAMLKLVAMGEHDVSKGRTYTHQQVFSEARRRLKERFGKSA